MVVGVAARASSLQVVEDIRKYTKKEHISSHICEAWEEVCLPLVAIQRAKKCHDYPLNTYAQRSIVQICSHLLSLYDLHWCQETDLQHTPSKMSKDSNYYDLVVQSSQALKQAMAARPCFSPR